MDRELRQLVTAIGGMGVIGAALIAGCVWMARTASQPSARAMPSTAPPARVTVASTPAAPAPVTIQRVPERIRVIPDPTERRRRTARRASATRQRRAASYYTSNNRRGKTRQRAAKASSGQYDARQDVMTVANAIRRASSKFELDVIEADLQDTNRKLVNALTFGPVAQSDRQVAQNIEDAIAATAHLQGAITAKRNSFDYLLEGQTGMFAGQTEQCITLALDAVRPRTPAQREQEQQETLRRVQSYIREDSEMVNGGRHR